LGCVKKGNQPEANRAARFKEASASPAIQIGGCGFCTGFGAMLQLRCNAAPFGLSWGMILAQQ
jgi:hypothetical protein